MDEGHDDMLSIAMETILPRDNNYKIENSDLYNLIEEFNTSNAVNGSDEANQVQEMEGVQQYQYGVSVGSNQPQMMMTLNTETIKALARQYGVSVDIDNAQLKENLSIQYGTSIDSCQGQATQEYQYGPSINPCHGQSTQQYQYPTSFNSCQGQTTQQYQYTASFDSCQGQTEQEYQYAASIDSCQGQPTQQYQCAASIDSCQGQPTQHYQYASSIYSNQGQPTQEYQCGAWIDSNQGLPTQQYKYAASIDSCQGQPTQQYQYTASIDSNPGQAVQQYQQDTHDRHVLKTAFRPRKVISTPFYKSTSYISEAMLKKFLYMELRHPLRKSDFTALQDILYHPVKQEYEDIVNDWIACDSDENNLDILKRVRKLVITIGEQARVMKPEEYKYHKVRRVSAFMMKKYHANTHVYGGYEKLYNGQMLLDAYSGYDYSTFDCLGCVSCNASVANALFTACWMASRCKTCIKHFGCESCGTKANIASIRFKRLPESAAVNVRPPKLINNRNINTAFLNAIPAKTTWMEVIGKEQFKLNCVSEHMNSIARGFNKGSNLDPVIDEIRNICDKNDWSFERSTIDAHENLVRAQYLANCIPRFKSNWATKTIICSKCQERFVNTVTMVGKFYVAERCSVCAYDTLYSPGYTRNDEKIYITFQGRSYCTSVKINSYV